MNTLLVVTLAVIAYTSASVVLAWALSRHFRRVRAMTCPPGYRADHPHAATRITA